jgi:hypothetical protein
MRTFKSAFVAFALLASSFAALASAQWGYGPVMGDQSWAAQMDAYNQAMDAFVQQQMQQAQSNVEQQYAQARQFFIRYYRQHTGDYATPDAQAVVLGDRLYCQHHPAWCQEQQRNAEAMGRISAAGHAQNMADIQSWGQTMLQIGQTNSGILDSSHQGYMDRQAAQDRGWASVVQGAVHGTAVFVNPGSGASYQLPVYPDPTLSYRTPDGYPLGFDYATNTWYQRDANGWWHPLGVRR